MNTTLCKGSPIGSGKGTSEKVVSCVSTEESEKYLVIIGAVVKMAMDIAGYVDTYKEIIDITEQSPEAGVKASDVEECIREQVNYSLPLEVLISSTLLQEFFVKSDYDARYQLKLLCKSEYDISDNNVSSIRLRTLKLLSSECGIKLSKSVGIDNFDFGFGFTMNEIISKLNNLHEQIRQRNARLN